MEFKRFLFTLIYLVVIIIETKADLTRLECLNDKECATTQLQNIITEYQFDPITVDKIIGYRHGLDYVVSPGVLTGLSQCEVTDISSQDGSALDAVILCPVLHLTGPYTVSGLLLNETRLEGAGDEMMVHSENYEFKFHAVLSSILGADGKVIQFISDFKLDMTPERVDIHWSNIENADEVHAYADTHGLAIADAYEREMFDPFLFKMFPAVQEYIAKN